MQVTNNGKSGWTWREPRTGVCGKSAEQDARDDNESYTEGWVVIVIHVVVNPVDSF